MSHNAEIDEWRKIMNRLTECLHDMAASSTAFTCLMVLFFYPIIFAFMTINFPFKVFSLGLGTAAWIYKETFLVLFTWRTV